MTTFEFDANKSLINKEKHGIDFHHAQKLWKDPMLIEIKASTVDEPRLVSIGKIDGKHWTAITTSRNDRLRIISVRRSRKTEESLYEKYNR